ncbi:OmpA family protein [Cytophagales bacterium LB-30]|uniref:OmpA family protein n=1 Tax=Shiella aurantiaca TaxID=3058365 RepID=A0ABT8F5Y9_9BACT|nr:OmpA family protein [Shiella aurantiaca]MDN4165641.1 OmpA family protein [Shiella aurantiaca]
MKHFFILLFLTPFALLAQDVDFENLELEQLGKEVNTMYHESAPIISPDGNTLYFFRANHPANNFGKDNSQDIWFSEKDQYGRWKEAVHAPSPLNAHRFNQVMSILDDGTVLLRGGAGKNSEGFSLSKNQNGRFSNLQELDVKNYKKMNKGLFSGACLSQDAKVLILYFSEKEKAKYSDLYVSTWIEGNKWSEPVKLPKNINTALDEFGPFIAHDNKTMYYAGLRPGGHGNVDIYYTKRLDDTWMNWSEPVNVGTQVNTNGFDAYFSIDANGNAFTTRAYMSADGGSLDILGLKPADPVILLSGTVKDKKTGAPINGVITVRYKGEALRPWYANDGVYQDTIPGKGKYSFTVEAEGYATVEENFNLKEVLMDTAIVRNFQLSAVETRIFLSGNVYNQKTEEPVEAKVSLSNQGQNLGNADTKEGYFLMILSEPLAVELSAQAEGFINASEQVDGTQAEAGDTLQVSLWMEPIEVGTTVRLNNIFFDFNASTLRPESYPELDKVVDFLVNNPSISIEIGGHTDAQGSDEYNLNLSQGRADSVRDYLISEGISSTRITAQGYGESQPETTNDTEEGRQQNRRVVFKVLEK